MKIDYNGKTYEEINGKWYYNYCEVPIYISNLLEKEADRINEINIDNLDFKELVTMADMYKNGKKYNESLKYYLKAIDIQRNFNKIKYIFARITSCYRSIGQPKKAIDFYNEMFDKYGSEVEGVELCTSVGAAYKDIKEYDEAKKLLNKALSLSNGNPDPELLNLIDFVKKNL